MTKYNTGNPVGSSSPLDLYDNAENLDAGINGPAVTWRDRRGLTRKSWAGVETDFQQFLADGSVISYATWAAAVAAAAAGQIPENRRVEITGDEGTHVDPVSGLTVSNSGRYVMSAGRLEWRSGDTIAAKADTSDVLLGNMLVARSGFLRSFGRPSIGIGDGISTGGATVADRRGFTVAGSLAEVRVYARVAGPAQLKIVARPFSGSLSGAVVASYPVYLSVGINRLRAGVNFPETDVSAGWTWAMYTATGMLARQSSSSNQTMTVGGDVTGATTWANTANTTQWQADVVTGEAVRDEAVQASARASMALGRAETVATEGFPLGEGTAFTTPSSNATRIIHYGLPYPAVVKRVTFITDGGTGLGFLKFLRKDAGDFLSTYTVESDHYFLPVSGRNDLVAGVDFPEGLVLPRGGAIGVYLSAQGISYSPSSEGGSLVATSNITGAGTFTMSSAQCNVEVELQYDFGHLPDGRLLIDDRLDSAGSVRAASGAWDFSGPGVLSPSGGDAVLHRPEYSVLDPSVTSIKFRVVDEACAFGVVKRAHEDQGTAMGTVAIYDQRTQQLQLMSWTRWDMPIPAEPARFIAVPFAFSAGDEGVLELKHVGAVNTAVLTKSKTRETVSLSHTSAGDSETGRCWGQPGVVQRAGRTRFLGLQYRLLTSRRPRLAVGIDSLTEGFTLANNWNQRWASLLQQQHGIEVIFAARGGASTVDFLRRSALDIGGIRPETWILDMGMPERARLPLGNTNAWRSRMHQIVDAIQLSGSVVCLATIPPTSTPSDMAFINAANAMILAGEFGHCPVVDFAAALSLNGDRVTHNPALFSADGYHPNVAGNAIKAAQVKADLPWIVD